MNTAILLIFCPDRRGLTAKITDFVYRHNGNIEHADQHIDFETNTFFMRIEWSLDGFTIPIKNIPLKVAKLASESGFGMDWSLYFSSRKPKVALFVSRETHCLHDILLRHQDGQLPCQIPLIISNHQQPGDIARLFGIKFRYFPKTSENKNAQEERELELLKKHKVELVILARYMQLLSKQFVKRFPNRIINIHHSFLPAFAGKKPYLQAHTRGVKLIGATSHFVTEDIDAGPIIAQQTVPVSHRDTLDDLKRKGRDLEKAVLGDAVRWYLERKILAYNNKTVIFD